MSFQTYEPGAAGLSGVSVLTVSPNRVLVAVLLQSIPTEVIVSRGDTGDPGNNDLVQAVDMKIVFSPLYNPTGADASGFQTINTAAVQPIRPVTGVLFPRGDCGSV